MTNDAPAAAAKTDSDDWHTTITACAYATMPNGGKVTMEGVPGHTFEEAVTHLEQTHALYISWSGWGGGR